MLKSGYDPRFVNLSVSLYRRLIAAYPSQFRLEYGEPMVQLFRDSCRRAMREGGTMALLALWARTAVDYLKTIFEENARGGVHMSREKFIN